MNEPFLIKMYNKKIIYNRYSSNYNYLTLTPWCRNNIIQCVNKSIKKKIRINKEQFMQALIVLFSKFK